MKQTTHRLLILSLAVLFGCKSTSTSPQGQTFSGTPTTVGTGTAHSWVKTDASGNFSSIGVTFTDGAFTSLGQMDTMIEIPIPTGVSSPFKSIAIDYATHDAAPYNKPHIDPHFFLIDMTARMSIMDGMDTSMPTGMQMPAGYAPMGASEMMMGTHWMDTTAPEMHGMPFQAAFVYGVSKGALVFMEAMCDKASLDGLKNISGTVRRPTMMSGMMMSIPATYSVSYDVTAKSSTIELDGFTQ